MMINIPTRLTWATLGVLSAWSFDTRILTMFRMKIRLICKYFCFSTKPTRKGGETHSVGHQHGRRDEIEKVGGLRPARPAGVLRGDAQLGGAVRPGACLGGHLSLHGDCPDTDEHHRHH